jgi:hypothetical protein
VIEVVRRLAFLLVVLTACAQSPAVSESPADPRLGYECVNPGEGVEAVERLATAVEARLTAVSGVRSVVTEIRGDALRISVVCPERRRAAIAAAIETVLGEECPGAPWRRL